MDDVYGVHGIPDGWLPRRFVDREEAIKYAKKLQATCPNKVIRVIRHHVVWSGKEELVESNQNHNN